MDSENIESVKNAVIYIATHISSYLNLMIRLIIWLSAESNYTII